MLHHSFFDAADRDSEKGTPYSVLCTPYSTSVYLEKVYTRVKKAKISLEVSSNLIFPKTVSSIFRINSLNSYLRFVCNYLAKFYPLYSFFLKIQDNGVRSTEYIFYQV